MAYAWSEIKVSADKRLKPGDKVTADDVGGADEFEALKAEGVIRDAKYPDFIRSNEAPKRALLRRANEAMEAAQAGVYDEHAPGILGSGLDEPVAATKKEGTAAAKQ